MIIFINFVKQEKIPSFNIKNLLDLCKSFGGGGANISGTNISLVEGTVLRLINQEGAKPRLIQTLVSYIRQS